MVISFNLSKTAFFLFVFMKQKSGASYSQVLQKPVPLLFDSSGDSKLVVVEKNGQRWSPYLVLENGILAEREGCVVPQGGGKKSGCTFQMSFLKGCRAAARAGPNQAGGAEARAVPFLSKKKGKKKRKKKKEKRE